MRRRVKIGKAFDLSAEVSGDAPRGNGQGKSKPSPKRVAVGQEFEAQIKFTSAKDLADINDTVTRTRMAWAVFVLASIFLLGSAVLGLYKGEFGELQGVWSVAGPVWTGIAGYFFHRQPRK